MFIPQAPPTAGCQASPGKESAHVQLHGVSCMPETEHRSEAEKDGKDLNDPLREPLEEDADEVQRWSRNWGPSNRNPM
ncbi:hypothetical protein NDU88_006288 [Pleurodeles waltl]|uniref:Uncharacterized protein n=1 Tax=Pleurodeles waltl TaxID=8319 RepID=A0AAV7PQY1_PLEWA|nr:hypothetical protein NDU88_006288 [Pleurodeles waltl]